LLQEREVKADELNQPSSEQRAPLLESTMPQLSSEDIRSQVAEAAYYRALQRGFTPEKELEDWLDAEAQIMTRPGAGFERN
jgi:hypothetical protein